MATIPDQETIDRFLSNRCSYAEAEEVYAYLENNPDALDKILLTEELREDELISLPPEIKKKIFNKVLGMARVHRMQVQRWLVAATIIGVMVISTLFLFRNKNTAGPEVAGQKIVKNNTTALLNYMLPDSSKLFLMPGAELIYHTGFVTDRIVDVTAGEVYFQVKKDKYHPFRVIVNGISTTAVGTQFWVQDLENSRIGISLTEGKVFIHSVDAGFKMDTVFLMPGQNCTIDKITRQVKVWTSNQKNSAGTRALKVPMKQELNEPNNTMIWTNKEIHFSNARLTNVFAKLEDRYNVKIITQDTSIYRGTITGKIFYNDSLDVLIASICEINQLSYEKSNDTIFLKRKP